VFCVLQPKPGNFGIYLAEQLFNSNGKSECSEDRDMTYRMRNCDRISKGVTVLAVLFVFGFAGCQEPAHDAGSNNTSSSQEQAEQPADGGDRSEQPDSGDVAVPEQSPAASGEEFGLGPNVNVEVGQDGVDVEVGENGVDVNVGKEGVDVKVGDEQVIGDGAESN
jgi:hypothetical protein